MNERANKAPEPTTTAVTIRAPSRTARARPGRGASLTLGKEMDLYRSEGAPAEPLARRKRAFAKNAGGFAFESAGRSGYIYYREEEKMTEMYWEMPGADDYDILLWLEGASKWILPREEKIPEDKRRVIVDALEAWLIAKKIRSDAFAPIKRSYFPKK